ncbi:hypothetical protein K490DRAFT_19363, partial [Saccharata proteae CBS 121410]
MASTWALPLDSGIHSHAQHAHNHQPHYNHSLLSSANGGALRKSPQRSNQYPAQFGASATTVVPSPHQHFDRDTSPSLPYGMPNRPKLRPRGESDLGRPLSKAPSATSGYGFPPSAKHVSEARNILSRTLMLTALHSASDSLSELVTGLLIPLPYILASLANSLGGSPQHAAPSTSAYERLVESVSDDGASTAAQPAPGSPFIQACALSSGTLLLVAILAKLSPSNKGPSRIKGFGNTGRVAKTGYGLDRESAQQIATRILSVGLPYYAASQIGGIRVSLLLLVAAASGLSMPSAQPMKGGVMGTLSRVFQERKLVCSYMLLAAFCDLLGVSANISSGPLILGYLAITLSIFVIPSPLPMPSASAMTSSQFTEKSRAPNGLSPLVESPANEPPPVKSNVPSATSSLISSPKEVTTTLYAGAILSVFTLMASFFISSSHSLSHSTVIFSALSIASAAGLYFFARPHTLQSASKSGIGIGCAFASIAGLATQPSSWISAILTAFLLRSVEPGSITHSILIEPDSRSIAYFGALNLAFMIVQFFYGFATGSLGLLTDSIHMLFDCAGLAVGLAAAVMSKWPSSARFPYGYGKVDTLSGFANGIFLLLVSIEIILDAFERLWEGHELHRLNELLIVSVLGFLVNIVGLTAFGHAHHHGHDHGHGDHDHHHGENMQGIFLHILADALGSVAVIISTLLTKWNGWSGWDPLASCIIAILIFGSALPLTYGAAMRLMLCVPQDVEDKLKDTLRDVNSIRGVVSYSAPSADSHTHNHSHSHSLSHDHSHSHSHSLSHDHDHSHSHSHGPRILGLIHIIAAKSADVEDVRRRTQEFLTERGLDVLAHVEREGDRCWCGG